VVAPSIYIIFYNNHFYVLQIIARKNGKLHFKLIDSLCKDPVVNYFLTSPTEFTYEYLSYQIQPYRSSLCAVYCIYFVNQLTKGRSIGQIIARFSTTNLTKNDKLISKYYDRLLQQTFRPTNFPYCGI